MQGHLYDNLLFTIFAALSEHVLLEALWLFATKQEKRALQNYRLETPILGITIPAYFCNYDETTSLYNPAET